VNNVFFRKRSYLLTSLFLRSNFSDFNWRTNDVIRYLTVAFVSVIGNDFFFSLSLSFFFSDASTGAEKREAEETILNF